MGIRLFVDDQRPPPDDSWTVARSVDEAKAQLLSGQVEHASFDHDMGEPPCDTCQGVCDRPCPHPCHQDVSDGTHLVNWMVENNIWPQHRPTVHSSNPAGRERMERLIEQHGPYGSIDVAT